MTAGQILSHELVPDKPESACSACGHAELSIATPGFPPINLAGSRRSIEGVLIMLCHNAADCTRRYRRGLTAAQYAGLLRAWVKAGRTGR